MEEGTRARWRKGRAWPDQAGAALREIEQIVKQTSSLVTDITKLAGDQVKVTGKASCAPWTACQVTQETTRGVQDTVATIRQARGPFRKRLTDAIGGSS